MRLVGLLGLGIAFMALSMEGLEFRIKLLEPEEYSNPGAEAGPTVFRSGKLKVNTKEGNTKEGSTKEGNSKGDSKEDNSKKEGSNEKCSKTCPTILTPVCGSDKKTYGNECRLENAACQSGAKLVVDHKGRCKNDCPNKCSAEEDDPVCGTNGKTYKNECELEYKKCEHGTKLHVAHKGKCGSKDKKKAKSLRQLVSEKEAHGFKCPTGELVYANPSDSTCKSYYHCPRNGTPYKMYCPNGYIFDPNSKNCNINTAYTCPGEGR